MRGRFIGFLVFAALWGIVGARTGLAASLDQLLDEVRQVRAEEARLNGEREQRFLAEQDAQQRLLGDARTALEEEKRRGEALKRVFDDNEQRIVELETRVEERSADLADMLGVVRRVAGEAKAVFDDSLISTQIPGRQEAMNRLAQSKGLPPIEVLEDLWFALQQEMTESGKVVSYLADVIVGDGSAQERLVTRIGAFNAVSNGRFLRHVPRTGQLEELTRQPAARYQRLAAALENPTARTMPMIVDPSRGAVLSLLVKVPGLVERIQQGRIVGYVIIGVAAIGLLIAIERLLHLSIIGHRVRRQLASDIPSCKNPLGRVLAVYTENRQVGTETLELKLDEGILSELPRLQRGLQTLRIMAVIAPLLGLLGTVTGLIDTFQSITLFGTGDPRLMAGGISQALVTTVLGLTAAIPLILLHTAVAGKSRRLVGILEEQSAGIVAEHAERQEGHVVVA